MNLLLLITLKCESNIFLPWLLWLLGAFILGCIFGWLLKKMMGNDDSEQSSSNTTDNAKIKDLEKQLRDCQNENKKLVGAASMATSIKTQSVSASSGVTTKSTASKSKKDDLTKIEGIGPKIKQLFYDDGITTFEDLANTDLNKMRAILDDAGSRFRMHNPKTWAKQARLAADGEWDKLNKLQDKLKGGL